jgi:peptide chain release factor 1
VSAVFTKLAEVEKRCEEIDQLLSDPKVVADRQQYRELTRERGNLGPIVQKFHEYEAVQARQAESRALLEESDPELRAMAQEELTELAGQLEALDAELRVLLTPKDPNDEKNIFLEIRAGTGGEEAALFAATLFRMYTRYAETRRWRIEIMSQTATGIGGLKEVIALVEGRGAYSVLKYEAGVHRVQRVPATEASGRIHTSAVTVAVMPEAEEVDVDIKPEELRIDVFRSSGPGGQSVNTTDSAVRMTHLPTGLVVSCQDEKSQHKNKAKALRILRARLKERLEEEQNAKRASERKGMVGTGDRSERIRTYNFPQNRVTDHRIGLTIYRLDGFLEGDIQEMINACNAHYQALALSGSGA